ncbi:MAG: hypothetical protein EWV90_13385, partial [Microcystis aeruginosa Ma_QC_Ch_20071001_M135]
LRFLSIVCDLERTNQLNLLPDQDLVDLGLHIESYQVTKNQNYLLNCQANEKLALRFFGIISGNYKRLWSLILS